MKRKAIRIPVLLTMILFYSFGCQDSAEEVTKEEEVESEVVDSSDWTEATHSNDVDPNYAVVFPEGELLRLDISIASEDWADMQADLDANMTSGGPGMGGPVETNFDPIWVPATVTFDGLDWNKVGIRYKGNSTLRNAYNSNSDKYPFKLDFDEFEDDFPQLKNQRFYGFKQLNLSNNDQDETFMREKVAADLFREFGVPAARTSFCEVYLDRGNGSQFIGIYTIVEEVDDSVPASQFADDNGNLYKPDGDAASLAWGTFDTEEMDLKTNEDEGDYSDVQALYDILHSDLRQQDETSWKTQLESTLDVDGFLKYLAVNNVIQNWDTYGVMTHNYFLYNDLGRLVWIPWDNNESMQDGKMGGAISLSMSEVTEDWPLIRYIMDVEAYEQSYKAYVSDFTANHFTVEQMENRFATYEDLLITAASSETSRFASSIATLINHVESRNTEVEAFLK